MSPISVQICSDIMLLIIIINCNKNPTYENQTPEHMNCREGYLNISRSFDTC